MTLDPALFAYCTAKHDSAGFTPFVMMYGQEARLPVDMVNAQSASVESDLGSETNLPKVAAASVDIMKKV